MKKKVWKEDAVLFHFYFNKIYDLIGCQKKSCQNLIGQQKNNFIC